MTKEFEKNSMSNAKSILPLINHYKLSSELSPRTDEEFDRMNKILYDNTIDSIMYKTWLRLWNKYVK